MRSSVQRFPIMSASICHTLLGHGEIKGRRAKKKSKDGGLTSLLQSGASDALLLAHPCLFFLFFSPLSYSLYPSGSSRRRWQGGTEGIEFSLIHLELLLHSYSAEARPIHAHLHSCTSKCASISNAKKPLSERRRKKTSWEKTSRSTRETKAHAQKPTKTHRYSTATRVWFSRSIPGLNLSRELEVSIY